MTYNSKDLSDDNLWGDYQGYEFCLPTDEAENKDMHIPANEDILKRIRMQMTRFISKQISREDRFDMFDLRSIARREINGLYELYGIEIDANEAKQRKEEVEELFNRLEPSITELIEEITFVGHKKRSIYTMNRIMAEAEVSKLLEDSGYDFYVRYNQNFAKVHIKITRQKKAVLYLKYDRLETLLPKVLETLENLKKVYDNFGAGSGVISLYKGDDDNFAEAREERARI